MCIGAPLKYTRTKTGLLTNDALNKLLIEAPYRPKDTSCMHIG